MSGDADEDVTNGVADLSVDEPGGGAPTGGGGGKKGKKGKKSAGGGPAAASGNANAPDGGGGAAGGAASGNLLLSHHGKLAEVIAGDGQQGTAAKDLEEARNKRYQFWETQPVPKFDDSSDSVNEPIEPDRETAEIREEPYSLPANFHWVNVNMDDEHELHELYTLLNENYVEDDDHMFRFDYSPAFLKWALMPPGWLPQWHCGVRATGNNKLVAFIAAVPCNIRIIDKVKPMVEINFLCVHKKLRSKRVAPVLIREITRRVNLQGIFQAVFTAGVIIPKPLATCRYYHRPLNPKKLIEVGFSYLSRNMTMQRTLKLYKLCDEPRTAGFRAMEESDLQAAYRLLSEYLKRPKLAPMFSFEEFTHFFTTIDKVVESFVVESPETGAITDFVSFYNLPSTVVNHAKYKRIDAAYSFYAVSNQTQWEELMYDALVLAKAKGYDVFNALNLMENGQFLKKLKFGIGDGNLNYYLYNWRCPPMSPEDIGLVLQ